MMAFLKWTSLVSKDVFFIFAGDFPRENGVFACIILRRQTKKSSTIYFLTEIFRWNFSLNVILDYAPRLQQAFRWVQFENFQNHEYLLFTNCTRRSCDFLFIVHSTKLRRFHGNLIGTPTEYNLGLYCSRPIKIE